MSAAFIVIVSKPCCRLSHRGCKNNHLLARHTEDCPSYFLAAALASAMTAALALRSATRSCSAAARDLTW